MPDNNEPLIPRVENGGRYLVEINDGRLMYLNHANTWQECPNFIAELRKAQQVKVPQLRWVRSMVFGYAKWRAVCPIFGTEYSCFSEGNLSLEQQEVHKAKIQAEYDAVVRKALGVEPVNDTPPAWKQDQAETTRMRPGPSDTPPAPNSIWRHHSGRLYRVLFITNAVDAPKEKYQPTVVYEGLANGKRWSGLVSDWHRRMTLEDNVNYDTNGSIGVERSWPVADTPPASQAVEAVSVDEVAKTICTAMLAEQPNRFFVTPPYFALEVAARAIIAKYKMEERRDRLAGRRRS